MTPDLQAIIKRLEKLEKQNRRLKQIACAAFILTASLVLVGQASPTKTVKANEFILSDANGKMRAHLYTESERTVFTLYDVNMKPTLMLDASKYGPGLYLSDSKDHVRAIMDATENGPHLTLSDAKGKVIWCAP